MLDFDEYDEKAFEYVPVRIFAEKGAAVPVYASQGASGADLAAAEDMVIPAGEVRMVPTGLSVQIPVGFEIQVRSRSGLAAKEQVFVLNSPGTVDSDYRGEVKVILANFGTKPYEVKKGARIAQAVLCPVYQAMFEPVETRDELEETERGTGGFGSTGAF